MYRNRHPRFSPTKDAEKYYQRLLQPFLPHWSQSHLKGDQFETFQNFYQIGAVKCGKNEPEPVKYIMERNKTKFELCRLNRQSRRNVSETCSFGRCVGPNMSRDRGWTVKLFGKTIKRKMQIHMRIVIPDLLNEENQSNGVKIWQSIVKRDEAENLLRCLSEKQLVNGVSINIMGMSWNLFISLSPVVHEQERVI